MIKIPELAVSKSHALITYSKTEKCFAVSDSGSVNGTLLNDDRLSVVSVQIKSNVIHEIDH